MPTKDQITAAYKPASNATIKTLISTPQQLAAREPEVEIHSRVRPGQYFPVLPGLGLRVVTGSGRRTARVIFPRAADPQRESQLWLLTNAGTAKIITVVVTW